MRKIVGLGILGLLALCVIACGTDSAGKDGLRPVPEGPPQGGSAYAPPEGWTLLREGSG